MRSRNGRGAFGGGPPRRTGNPLYDDVLVGRGGIAGGRFTLGGDTFTQQGGYVDRGYIEGQDAYVQERSN